MGNICGKKIPDIESEVDNNSCCNDIHESCPSSCCVLIIKGSKRDLNLIRQPI